MAIGTTAALIGAGIAAAGGVASSAIGAHSASSAAQQQKDSAQAAIDEQKRQFDITNANYAPWLASGTNALSLLTAGTQPGGSLVTPYSSTFVAPTLDNTNDPGYAFRLAQGEQAIKRAAAASGGAFSGGTLAALTRYGQDYASNEYNNVYSRALNTFNTNFNAYNTGQTNQFNRLAALAGMGQTATTSLGSLGQSNANTISGFLTDQGNAGAAGTLGVGSSINSGIQNAIGNYYSGSILNSLTQGSGGGKVQPLPTQATRYNPFQYVPGLNPATYNVPDYGYEGM